MIPARWTVLAVFFLLLGASAGAQEKSRFVWKRKTRPTPAVEPVFDPARIHPVPTPLPDSLRSPSAETRPAAATLADLADTSLGLPLDDRASSWALPDAVELPVPQWVPMEVAVRPSPRFRFLMTYQTHRQRTLLFGGFLENQETCNETWEFDGRAWKQFQGECPPADSGYMLAYDISRGVAVLYGGRGRETWEFDGARWRTVACEHRPPIVGQGAMAYDPKYRRIVLFGGETLSPTGGMLPMLSAEAWQYDGRDWTPLEEPAGPSPRKGHRMVYDSARERFVVFGGFDGKWLNETWELRETGWRRVETETAPSPRSDFAVTYDPAGRRTLLFGGSRGGDELWSFDGARWTQIMAVNSPPYREGAGLLYIPVNRRVLLFGGLSSKLQNDQWLLLPGAPEKTVLLPPPPDDTAVGPVSESARLLDKLLADKALEKPLPEPPRPAGGVRTPPPPLPPPEPPAQPEDFVGPPKPGEKSTAPLRAMAEDTTRSKLAELHFRDVTVIQSTLIPGQIISVAGFLVNSGKSDARCWVEFWLSETREPFVRKRLLCPSESIEIKAGQWYDLWRLRPLIYQRIAPGQYYVGLEVDRSGEVDEQDETNNLYVVETPFRVAPEP